MPRLKPLLLLFQILLLPLLLRLSPLFLVPLVLRPVGAVCPEAPAVTVDCGPVARVPCGLSSPGPVATIMLGIGHPVPI